MRRLLPLLLAAPLFAAPSVPDDHVAEALKAAGDNAPQLQRVLDHFAKDKQRLTAARFLIANMPGHGYIVTRLKVKESGETIEYDTLAYANFKASLAALDELEKEHGELEWGRERKIEDTQTIKADFLIRHIDNSFEVWQRTPEKYRVSFEAFLEYVLPYRGSQEPLEDWLSPLMHRYAFAWQRIEKLETPAGIAKWVGKDLGKGVRFNERFYLHPTDQSMTEMLLTGQGRCEDLTNLGTFAKRSVGIAVAADYTPWWARGDNNHAWDVVLGKDGKITKQRYTHAGKIYRKTFAIQRGALRFRLPEGREAANRFMASPFCIDVTNEYMETTRVTVPYSASRSGADKFVYLCVFNGGTWKAIQWAEAKDGQVSFDHVGRNIVCLPMTHDGKELKAISDPVLVLEDGTLRTLTGKQEPTAVIANSVRPKRKSVDTGKQTDISYLKDGQIYILKRWQDGAWQIVGGATAKDKPLTFENLAADGLYWLVPKDDSTRRLERVFTIENGRQLWW